MFYFQRSLSLFIRVAPDLLATLAHIRKNSNRFSYASDSDIIHYLIGDFALKNTQANNEDQKEVFRNLMNIDRDVMRKEKLMEGEAKKLIKEKYKLRQKIETQKDQKLKSGYLYRIEQIEDLLNNMDPFIVYNAEKSLKKK